MSLNGALNIGRSALVASQAAMQVAGNNMANAATKGYHRRTVHLAAAGDELIQRAQFVGTGVQLLAIRREVDTAMQSRFRNASSQENSALISQRFLTALETIQNELTDNDLSSELSNFFNSFSELANNPEDHAVRTLVIEHGRNLANRLSTLLNQHNDILAEVDRALATAVLTADGIVDRIAQLNIQIAQTEQGRSQANALRDQRDLLIDELAEFLDVSVVEQPNGALDVFVGSIPVVLSGISRGLEMRTQSVGNQVEVTIRVAADGTQLQVDAGRIGGLMQQRSQTVQPAIDDLNTFASQLIFEVNRQHAQGQGRTGQTSVTGTYGVNDPTATLNSAAAGLDFPISNGSFFIHVTHQATGLRTTHQINVNGNADSLNDLINEINVVVGVPSVTAATGLGNTLTLTAASGFQISFSDDTSSALAALGINTFFDGANASDIDINQIVANDPDRLAAGAGHVPGSNGTALAMANLQNQQITALSDRSLREFWQESVNGLAVRTAAANDSVDATRLVRESLSAQIQAVSGVSLDEESINLLLFQRQFQAAARFIAVIDETLQTLLSIA